MGQESFKKVKRQGDSCGWPHTGEVINCMKCYWAPMSDRSGAMSFVSVLAGVYWRRTGIQLPSTMHVIEETSTGCYRSPEEGTPKLPWAVLRRLNRCGSAWTELMRRDSIINSLSRAGVYWIDEEIKGHSNQKGKHYGLDHVCQQERTPQTMAYWGVRSRLECSVSY